MENSEREKAIDKISKKIAKIFANNKAIVCAYLYGSYARGEKFSSDIDIAIYLKPGAYLSLEEELYLAGKLEEESGLKPIDLRIINDMPLTFQGEVITRGRLLYSSSNDRLRVNYENRIYSLFFDYLPYLKKLRREFLHNVAEEGVL